jgi:LmbE family N-acetylglucosaminyl deacetylase
MTATDVHGLGTVLGIWAHPDDEAFLSAGLMAAARTAGQRVVCVTATLGEHGTSDPVRWPPERLARVRAYELRASLAALGVNEHHPLGIADGGCADQPFEVVVDRVAGILDDVRPDTIVTFGPDGLTGHRDHQAVSAWATAARTRAASGARLLYATLAEELIVQWRHVYDRVRVFLTDGLPGGTPTAALSVQLRLGDELADRKLVALRAQATQTAELVAVLGEDTVREWCSVESFVDGESVVVADRWRTCRPAVEAR